MEINVFQNVTILNATIDMIENIDNSDFLIDHIVIVPDRFSLQCEKLLLEKLNGSLFNVKVRSLTRFSQELITLMNIDAGDVLSSGDTLLFTQKAIENVKSQLKSFKKNKIAFAQEVSKLLSQFKSCNVSPSGLNDKLSGLTGDKYRDLKLIYEEYNRLLEGRLDVNERLNLLIENFKEIDELKSMKIYFAGFDAMTAQSWGLIQKLVHSCECSFAIARSRFLGNEYIYDNDILERLTQIASQENLMLNVSEKPLKLNKNQLALIKGVYSYSQHKCENEGYFNLYSAASFTEEIEACAKLIRYKIYNGLRYKDIQVAVSDLEGYESQIENIFNRYDIPFYIDSSLSADKTLLGRAVLEFLDSLSMLYGDKLISLLSNPLYGDKLISLLSNPLFGDNSSLIAKCQLYKVDNLLRYKKYIEREFAFAENAKELISCKTAAQMCEATRKLLSCISENFDQTMTRLEEENKLKEKNINLQMYEIMGQCLDSIGKFDNEISLEEFRKKLHLLLSFKEVSTVPSFIDGVMVGDATSSFFRQSDTLILLGSESLPIVSSDNGLLSDEEMSLNIKELQPTIRMINRRNRFRVYSLLPLAQNSLTLFYQYFSSEGKKNEIPTFVSDLCKIFDQIEIKSSHIFFNYFSDSLQRTLISARPKNTGEKIYNKWEENEKIKYINEDKLRVTQIEEYFSCPFKHFARFGLKLKEKEDFELSQSDIGNICHNGSEIFVKELMQNNFNLNVDFDEKAKEILPLTFDDAIKAKLELIDEKETLIRFLTRQLKNLFKDILRDLEKSSFKPLYLEKNLSCSLEVDGKNYKLIGRADRIDSCQDYFRIIDYKTGETGNVLKQLYYGEKLQLFLYQKMAQEKLNKTPAGGYYFSAKLDYAKSDDEKAPLKGLAPNDSDILNLLDNDLQEGDSSLIAVAHASKGGFKGSGVSKYSLNELISYSEKVIKKAISEIESGFKKSMPISEACKYCKAKALCGYEEAMGERACPNEKVEF